MKKYLLIGITSFLALCLIFTGYYFLNTLAVLPEEANNFPKYTYTEQSEYYHFPSKNPESKIGVIIYQGAKVEPMNYAAIAHQLQVKNYNVFVSKMPFSFAFFNSKLAGKIMEEYSAIDSWFLGGHSLGGTVVSQYAHENMDNKIKGLFFLASYPTKDFQEMQIPMFYLFAEQDGLIDQEDRTKGYALASKSPLTKQQTIPGANHAQFGNYGPQSGDNAATITALQQQQLIVQQLDNWFKVVVNPPTVPVTG